MNSEDAEYLMQRINQEGFDYCFRHYSDFDEIRDPKFHKLRKRYLKVTHELESYIKEQTQQDE